MFEDIKLVTVPMDLPNKLLFTMQSLRFTRASPREAPASRIDPLKPVNPFTIQDGIVGMANDRYLSYNSTPISITAKAPLAVLFNFSAVSPLIVSFSVNFSKATVML